MTLGEMLERSAKKYPEKTALIFQGIQLSYQEFDQQVNKLANGLSKLGINKGDKVAVLMTNSIQFVLSYYAIARLGGIIVPLNIMLKGEELKYILEDAQAKALFTMDSYLKVVKAIRPSLPQLANVIVDGEFEGDGLLDFQQLIREEAGNKSEVEINPHDIVVYLYTSGTTGHPKGAMLSHYNLIANCEATQEHLKFKEQDCFMCVLPMFHTFAATVCMNTPIWLGSTISIIETFIPVNVLKALDEDQVTVFAGVPSMYTVLVNMDIPEGKYDLSNLRLCISGGSSMPVEVLKRVEKKFGVRITEGYGLSETSPVVTMNPPTGARKPGSIGLAIPGVEVKIFNDQDQEVGVGEVGEIVIKGPNVMKGYYNLPEATEQAFRSGWFHSGDVGKMDEENFVYIVDRKKDMIIVGGLNVYPREVEEILYTHPAVAEAAVIGIPDELRGEAVKAVVALKPGQQVKEKELIKYCRDRLATYKVPRYLEFRDSLPKTGTGKILKRALKE